MCSVSFSYIKSKATSVSFLSITVGEVRRGVELIRVRGDVQQAELLERWLLQVKSDFANRILAVDLDVAEL